ncbi:hypothetical protein M422DRAFT_35619, partial [Sphaerobolus stellatus SS14]
MNAHIGIRDTVAVTVLRMARRSPRSHLVSPLTALNVLLLTKAEDDDDEFSALLVLTPALRPQPSARFGPRGGYNKNDTERFCDMLL